MPSSHMKQKYIIIAIAHTVIFKNIIIRCFSCPARRWRSVITMNNNGRRDVVTIRFPIFFLFPDEPEFYLHCSVGACGNCEPNDVSLKEKSVYFKECKTNFE